MSNSDLLDCGNQTKRPRSCLSPCVSGLYLRFSTLDLLNKELGTLIGAQAVRQVGRQNEKLTKADRIARLANNLHLIGREVGDLIVVLLLLSIPVEHNAGDLVLNSRIELLDSAVVDGCALRVTTSYDDRVWTLLCH